MRRPYMYAMLDKINEAFNDNPRLDLSFTVDKFKATVHIRNKGVTIEKQFNRESLCKSGNLISCWLGGLQF